MSEQGFVFETDAFREARLLREASLVRLARRLGVAPLAKGETAMIVLATEDGTQYSWEALIFAHLDAMERHG